MKNFFSKIAKNSLVLLVVIVLFILTTLFYSQLSGLLNVPIYNSITNQSISALLKLSSGEALSVYLSLLQSILVIAGIINGVSVLLLIHILSDKEFMTSIHSKGYSLLPIIILLIAIFGFALPLLSATNAIGAIENYAFYYWNTRPPNTYFNVVGWYYVCNQNPNTNMMIQTSNTTTVSCSGIYNIYRYMTNSYNDTLSNTYNSIQYLLYGIVLIIIVMILYALFKLS